MTNDDVLLIETADRVRTLTLNRPQSRNALSSALRKQFFAALRDAEADDAVDVVILTRCSVPDSTSRNSETPPSCPTFRRSGRR